MRSRQYKEKISINNNSGTGSLEDGTRGAVELSNLGEHGCAGTYSNRDGVLPW